jgi:hypothetical protein
VKYDSVESVRIFCTTEISSFAGEICASFAGEICAQKDHVMVVTIFHWTGTN